MTVGYGAMALVGSCAVFLALLVAWWASGLVGKEVFTRLRRIYHLTMIGYWLDRLEKQGPRVFRDIEKEDATRKAAFTPAEIDENPRLKFEPENWVRRADGKVVRVDRWEWGIRAIVSTLWGNRHDFEVDEVVQAVEALAAPAKWGCFHCDEAFSDEDAAREHFGKSEHQQPACQIDIAEYRKMEEVNRRHCEEDTDLHRQILSMSCDHQQALQREEEKGYARGLRDGMKEQAAAVTDEQIDAVVAVDFAGSDWSDITTEQWRNIARIFIALALPAQAAAVPEAVAAIKWPASRDIGRMGDMTPARQSVLRVGLDSDNDVYVNLWDAGHGDLEQFQNVSIEFCNGGGGGGKSPRTRAALINLMSAIEADNAEDDSKAWPFRRLAAAGGAKP